MELAEKLIEYLKHVGPSTVEDIVARYETSGGRRIAEAINRATADGYIVLIWDHYDELLKYKAL